MTIPRKHIKSDIIESVSPQLNALTNGAIIKEHSSNDNGWYILFTNGICFQFGHFILSMNGGLANGKWISLPKSFNTTEYPVFLQIFSGQGQGSDICVDGDRETSRFKVWNMNQAQNGNTYWCVWMAVGVCNI